MPDPRLAIVLLALAVPPAVASEPLRDPTRPYTPAVAPVKARSGFVVNAIIVSDERRIAIVNGRRVGVGGTVDGATVLSIAKHELTLAVENREMTLGLATRGKRQ